ncbi:hypothetical protein [Butyricimonas sp. Marseille-P3923]|uniref:hypothetical protein n=1 Tax=Butyricimonas sp. Marseille-P3923 TaxID=1987504 RepID=UPI000C068102|nr:hypothetical protein [Butyricimonas sp. Marseille-P3923]
MKNRFNFIIFAFILLLTSCIKDKAQEEEKVSVVLTFNTRSVSETYDTDSGEGIQSIRVIIAQNGTVVKNEYYPELSYNASLSSRTFTIFDVPVGNADFYIIANADKSGITDWTPYNVGQTPSFDLLTRHVMTTANGIVEPPFPIAQQFLNQSIRTNGQELNFSIIRSVVKLNFMFTNKSDKDITLEQIKLGTFVPDKTFLFPQKSRPVDLNYHPLNMNNINQAVQAGTSFMKTVYIYENTVTDTDAYTVAIVVDGYTYEPLSLNLTSITRNTQINIKMTITPSNVGLSYIVADWTNTPVTIPPFD